MSENQCATARDRFEFDWSAADAKAQSVNDERAASVAPSRARPADLRLHFGGYFIRIIAGKERRSRERLKQDRKDNPAFALKNLPLIFAIWAMSSAALLFFLSRMLHVVAQLSGEG